MTIIYNEMDEASLHLTTSFCFEDGADRVDVKRFDGDLFKVENGGYYLKGMADVVYTTECDRCGGPAVLGLKADIAVMIEPVDRLSNGSDGAEYEMTDEDGDVFYSERESLDLHELLRQEIILQFPVKRLCGQDCTGFDDYNEGNELSETATPLNSLAALKALKEK